jgi:O-antigen/teichoic acid export membrane protein
MVAMTLQTAFAKGRQHLTLLLNAAAMMGSTLATAGLGFVYWWVAARGLSAESVGLASAAIATMGFLALAGDLGLGTLLMGQMPRHPDRVGGLVSAAFVAATAGSALLGLVYLGVLALAPAQAVGFPGDALEALVFVLGVALTGLILVLDQTLLGVLKGQWHLARNISFAVAKLLLLVLAIEAGSHGPMAVYGSWALGNFLSLLVLALVVRREGVAVFQRPDLALLRGLTGPILSHHALNVLSQAPGLLMPVLVTHLLSASVNAAFYAAWLLIGVAYLAPASLTTALYAVAARDTSTLARKLRFTLATSMGLSLVTILLCALLGGFALRLFNPAYVGPGEPALWLLALSMPGVVLKYHYIAIKRIRDEMGSALPLLGLGAVLELVVAAIGGQQFGLKGLVAGWALAGLVEAAFMLPTLIGAARSRPR